MTPIAYYLLKVIFCSGILYGYYHLALRDKLFHQWNRFYLLGVMVVSCVLPLLTIHVDAPQSGSKVITALHVVNGADVFVKEVNRSGSTLPLQSLAMGVYAIGASLVLLLLIRALHALRRMISRNQPVNMNDFIFINTAEPGTPFSFFRYLLWNREISLDTENGKRILEHELVHIREKHSHDKIFIQMMLIPFWINPFFWLIRREVSLIHEFIADRRAVEQGDATALAKLLLETSFPGYAPLMTSSFFKNSIKRRLAMINMHNAPRFNYLSRIMMIPMISVLFFTVAVKARNMHTQGKQHSEQQQTETGMADAGLATEDAAGRTDTIPKTKNLKKVTLVYGDGSKETISPEEYRKRTERRNVIIRVDSVSLKGSGNVDPDTVKHNKMLPDAEYFIDGEPSTKIQVESLSVSNISSLKITKASDGGTGRMDIRLKGNTIPTDARIDGIFIEKTGKDSMKVVINGTGSAVSIKGDPNKPRPLYIVNGKELTESDIKDIDPNSIEKIRMLKGASAESIYKEKGKNGVVIITLKK